MPRSLFTIILILCCTICFGQDPSPKFGKISREYLDMKVFPQDSAAEAVYLLRKVNVSIIRTPHVGTVRKMITTYHFRIKLFNEKGIERFGNQVIRDLIVAGYRSISKLKASVFLPSGEEIKLDKKDFFKENVIDEAKAISFAFPRLEKGAIIEWSYEVASSATANINWQMQKDIPVLYSAFEFIYPKDHDYVFVTNGTHPVEYDEKIRGNNYTVRQYTARNLPTIKMAKYSTTKM